MGLPERLHRLTRDATRADLLHFLSGAEPGSDEALFAFADRVRREHVGDAIHLRAIVEFSSFCRNDCLYCGLRRSNRRLRRLRMPLEEIVAQCRRAAALGFRTVVLQSGEDPFYGREAVVDLVRRVKGETGLAVTLALGERSEEEYRSFYEAGADRYLLKHETSDRGLYERLDPGLSHERRIDCLRTLKRIGFQTGSGIMVGLPGQTLESVADDILLFRDLDIDMIGCGPFIPHPQTPLAGAAAGSEELTYRVVALARVVTRDTHIPATTALAVMVGDAGRANALCRGANVVMPNITPQPWRRAYEIYPHKGRTEVFEPALLERLRRTARELGRFIAEDAGPRVRTAARHEARPY
jgi:biotin synthase